MSSKVSMSIAGTSLCKDRKLVSVWIIWLFVFSSVGALATEAYISPEVRQSRRLASFVLVWSSASSATSTGFDWADECIPFLGSVHECVVSCLQSALYWKPEDYSKLSVWPCVVGGSAGEANMGCYHCLAAQYKVLEGDNGNAVKVDDIFEVIKQSPIIPTLQGIMLTRLSMLRWSVVECEYSSDPYGEGDTYKFVFVALYHDHKSKVQYINNICVSAL
ncbi:hypothetical protein G9A89_009543 [Geosiphon pyriformis]|nr:hypothetical protein G9A89_009543 [Geosiphon pyriformis]